MRFESRSILIKKKTCAVVIICGLSWFERNFETHFVKQTIDFKQYISIWSTESVQQKLSRQVIIKHVLEICLISLNQVSLVTSSR